jgi:Tol biopolymer transport system component
MKPAVVLAAAALGIAWGANSSQASTSSVIVFAADRAPSVSGEIYRLEPNGRRIDLSRSSYEDSAPVVAPDGKHVAFASNRTPKGAVYEVGINGRGLRRISPRSRFGFDNSTALAWQPHGSNLAIAATRGFWIVGPGHKPVNKTALVYGFATADPWSPDGRILLALTWDGGPMVALNAQGSKLWSVPHQAGAAWSKQGLLAVADGKGFVAVYDENGQLRFKVRIGARYASPSWSPDGSRFALIAWPTLREWTSTGQLLLHKRLDNPDAGLAWAGPNRLVVATGQSSWFAPRSADGKLAIVTSPKASSKQGSRFALGVASPGSKQMKTYAHVPGCWSDAEWQAAVANLQFAGRSIVYQTACYEPPSNLYSVAPDGSGLRKIATVEAWATQPSISPNGAKIAYSWAEATGLSCKGCPLQIRVANSDGTGVRVLTKPSDAFDRSPTWSPDGKTILFSESNPNDSGELYTVPAKGGAVHDVGLPGKEPAWGPARIAYQQGGIWTANPDGSDPVRVSKSGEFPAWSSDGRLAYLEGSGGRTLVVGTTTFQLPFAQVESLAWSPDGTHFVVTASKTRSGPPDVYTIRTDGTHLVRLTKNYDATAASWG